MQRRDEVLPGRAVLGLDRLPVRPPSERFRGLRRHASPGIPLGQPPALTDALAFQIAGLALAA
jgi:hypothetical protein